MYGYQSILQSNEDVHPLREIILQIVNLRFLDDSLAVLPNVAVIVFSPSVGAD